MNRKFYTVIVIFYTCFSIYIIGTSKVSKTMKYSETIATPVQDNNEVTIKVQNESNDEQGDNDISDSKERYIFEKQKELQQKLFEGVLEQSEPSIREMEEDIKVLKEEPETIASSLTFPEKGRLLILSTKLSRKEIKTIQNYIKYSTEMEAVKGIYSILKEKLTPKELESVVEIFSKYVDIELIEP